MKMSKMGQRLFNLIVAEIRNEIAAYDECDNYMPPISHIIDMVLEDHGIEPCCDNPDYSRRLYNAIGCEGGYDNGNCNRKHGVISLTAAQMEPPVHDYWWRDGHHVAEVKYQTPPLLLSRTEAIGEDFSKLDWSKLYAPKFTSNSFTPQEWDNEKFVAGFKSEIIQGKYYENRHKEVLELLMTHPLVLTVDAGVSFDQLNISCISAGGREIYHATTRVNTNTHRKREWRCGREVAKLLIEVMYILEDMGKMSTRRTKYVREVPNVGFNPMDLSLALTKGVYLEY